MDEWETNKHDHNTKDSLKDVIANMTKERNNAYNPFWSCIEAVIKFDMSYIE